VGKVEFARGEVFKIRPVFSKFDLAVFQKSIPVFPRKTAGGTIGEISGRSSSHSKFLF
jgi:hypothetical protein